MRISPDGHSKEVFVKGDLTDFVEKLCRRQHFKAQILACHKLPIRLALHL
jgi:hypothetical protein